MKLPLAVTCMLLISPAVFANCDNNQLTADQVIECITVEGAGENYDHWKKEYAMIGSGLSREEDNSRASLVIKNRSGQVSD